MPELTSVFAACSGIVAGWGPYSQNVGFYWFFVSLHRSPAFGADVGIPLPLTTRTRSPLIMPVFVPFHMLCVVKDPRDLIDNALRQVALTVPHLPLTF